MAERYAVTVSYGAEQTIREVHGPFLTFKRADAHARALHDPAFHVYAYTWPLTPPVSR